jgi:hypothetical protein
MRGEPIRAGIAQNHDAHIDAHLAQIQSLQGSRLPVEAGQAALAVFSAHIAEHMALQLAAQVAQVLGVPVEMFEQGIPPEIEAQIAPALTAAVVQVEQMRRQPSEMDVRLQIEQLRAANKAQIEQIRANTQLAVAASKARENQLDNKADMMINDRDNATAIIIARMKTAQPRPETRPHAPTNNLLPSAEVRRQ